MLGGKGMTMHGCHETSYFYFVALAMMKMNDVGVNCLFHEIEDQIIQVSMFVFVPRVVYHCPLDMISP